jgi:DnaJ like chaperone protein
VMDQMKLQPEQRKLAIGLFEQGKQPGFPSAQVLEQFRRECLRRRNLIQMFLEILTATALADGAMAPAERRVLDGIALGLGLTQAEYDQLVLRMNAQFRFTTDARPQNRLEDAYKVLGLASTAETAEVKKAYRKLMAQHHPDKLVSKGLPEEMMEIAKRKTQEIKSAYDTIMAARGE